MVVNIPDPNVYIELQHYIEGKGGYVDSQLNPKLLKVPVGIFISLMLDLSQEDDLRIKEVRQDFEKKLIKELGETYQNENDKSEKITKDNWTRKLTKTTFPTVGKIIKEIFSFSAPIVSIIANLMTLRS